jgi:hypothetical protein
MTLRHLTWAILCLLLSFTPLLVVSAPAMCSDDAATPFASAPQRDIPVPGTRRALVICGLPGDAEHRQKFGESLEMIYTGLTSIHGFSTENIQILWGDAANESDGPAVKASRGVASRASIAAATAELQKALQPADTLWVVVMGHSHFDGRHSWLNLSGDDIHQVDFGKIFEEIRAREQVFFLTTPASGYYLKPLAMQGRIVITATEPDLEVNETHYPHKLAQALSGGVSAEKMEFDHDGHLTLLDLYLWVAQEVAQEYASGMQLATEHALIDDNGDGRGTEVQIDFLSEELGGRLRAGQTPVPGLKGDGVIARHLVLAQPPGEKPPEVNSPP